MEKKKIKALYQLIFLNVFVGKKLVMNRKRNLILGKWTKTDRMDQVNQIRPNGPSGPNQTEWIEGTEVDRYRLNWSYSLFCIIILVLLSKALLFFP